MPITVEPGQSPSLWAKPWPLIQNQTPESSLAGTAPAATSSAGCESARSAWRVPRRTTPERSSPSVPSRHSSPREIASDAPALAPGSPPRLEHQDATPAIPIVSATPTTASASAAGFATRYRLHFSRSGHRSRAPSLPESNPGTALRRSPLPHTTAMDAANPATGSSCGRSPGTRTAAPKSESILRQARRLDGCRSHAPARTPRRCCRGPTVRIACKMEVEALQPTGRPHCGRRVARHLSPDCVE